MLGDGAEISDRDRVRSQLVEVAASLLHTHGPSAVTTRAVAEAAGAQAPTIYRLFGDKDGLLDAVAEHVFAAYVDDKVGVDHLDDPLADLRAGWDTHLGFGLANPALFRMLADPSRAASAGAEAGMQVLATRVHRVAQIGRLRVAEPRAVNLIHAAGMGAVLSILSMPAALQDVGLGDAMYDAVSAAILTDAPALPIAETTASAVTFRTVVPDLPSLTDAERALMRQWLDRAIDPAS